MELVAKCDRFSRLKHSTAFPLDEMEGKYDRQFKVVFDAIRDGRARERDIAAKDIRSRLSKGW